MAGHLGPEQLPSLILKRSKPPIGSLLAVFMARIPSSGGSAPKIAQAHCLVQQVARNTRHGQVLTGYQLITTALLHEIIIDFGEIPCIVNEMGIVAFLWF